MKKILLASDDYVYVHQSGLYAQNASMYEMYQRYLRVYDALKIVARCIDEEDLNPKRVKICDTRIEIVQLPITHGVFQYARNIFENKKILKGVADDCNAVIYRLPSTVSIDVYASIKNSGLPYATEVVFDAFDGYQTANGIVDKFAWLLMDRKMRKICYNADGVSCVTEKYLQRRYHSKVQKAFRSHYSSVGLENSFFGSEKYFPINKPVLISHVALQVEYKGRKGHNELLHALKKVRSKGKDVRVLFAGEDYNDGIKRLRNLASELGIDDYVNFLGFVDKQELAQLLNDSDIFVLPTKAEGLPRVIIEAMAKGLPCITTNVSGNPELIEDQYLIDYHDIDSLADRILRLLENKDEYERCSKRNLEVSKLYRKDVLEKRRDLFYQSLYDIS